MSKRPPYLKKNDVVAIVATAKKFDKKDIEDAIGILSGWGLRVLVGENLFNEYHQFAGSDTERLQDLQTALDHPMVKAIFCARGGYGTTRIIDKVSFNNVKKNPKWVVGFSDVTTLHAELDRNKIQSIHGLMPIAFSKPEYKTSLEGLKKLLFGKIVSYKITSHTLNRLGEAEGILVGGNVSILCALLATPSELITKGKILFLEDVGENLYRIDRMIGQLKRAGVLAQIKGLVVGHFTDMEDNTVPFGQSAYQIIQEAVQKYKYPVAYHFLAGHEAPNLPLVFGSKYRLVVKKSSVELSEI